MPALNLVIREHLARSWREDLPPTWRAVFANAEPDLNQLPNYDVPEIFPSRLNLGRPRNEQDVGPIRHMLRAFDGLAPDEVRVVILGQDPYPRRDRATGRAFEDGAWNEALPRVTAKSLRRLLQSAAACERPELGISERQDDWGSVHQAMHDGELPPPAVPGFFDSLAAQGVLCVNTAWTFTGTSREQLGVNIGVWRPVVDRLLLELVQHEDWGPIVFLFLGAKARDRFRAATFQHLRANPERLFDTVYCAHPTAWRGRTYFEYENPLRRVNDTLIRLGADPVRWWPLVGEAA